MGVAMVVVVVIGLILVVLFLDLLGIGWLIRKLWRGMGSKPRGGQ